MAPPPVPAALPSKHLGEATLNWGGAWVWGEVDQAVRRVGHEDLCPVGEKTTIEWIP